MTIESPDRILLYKNIQYRVTYFLNALSFIPWTRFVSRHVISTYTHVTHTNASLSLIIFPFARPVALTIRSHSPSSFALCPSYSYAQTETRTHEHTNESLTRSNIGRQSEFLSHLICIAWSLIRFARFVTWSNTNATKTRFCINIHIRYIYACDSFYFSFSLPLDPPCFPLFLSLACALLSSPFHSRNTTFPSLVLSQHEGEGEGGIIPEGKNANIIIKE